MNPVRPTVSYGVKLCKGNKICQNRAYRRRLIELSTRSVDFFAVPVYFMTVTVGSLMDVSLKMNARKSGFSPLL